MEQANKIPIVIGVTGHRYLADEDKPAIYDCVKQSLEGIRSLCKSNTPNGEDTPIVMLNAFAQGADMLCAEAAFELGIDVYALLPCPKEKYIESFDDEADRAKLFGYLEKTKRQILAPDMEENREWLASQYGISASSYEYRQLGIYMAEHSHILLALWDGQPPKGQFGCGAAEVVNFALDHKYLDREHLFKPSAANDSAVLWVKVRRRGDTAEADVQTKWLFGNQAAGATAVDKRKKKSEYEEFVEKMLKRTVEYNAASVQLAEGKVKLWEEVEKLDGYRKALRYHYMKADAISSVKNQSYYDLFLKVLAILGTLVASAFLIYDDASLPFMILPCTALLCTVLVLTWIGRRKKFHANYIRYRAIAEALRIQFYATMCMSEGAQIVMNVCNLYSWTQKVEMAWIYKTIQALAIVSPAGKLDISPDRVIEVWLGNNQTPTGQLRYHRTKHKKNRNKAKTYDTLSTVFQVATIAYYFILFVVEVVALILKSAHVDWFWEHSAIAHVTFRNLGAIGMGLLTAGTLLLSSYWGKLSYARKASDNEKMIQFYAAACERWSEAKACTPQETDKFIREIAREEIVENGVWCSYVSENRLEVNI